MLGQGKGSRLDPKRFYQRRSWQLEKAEKSLTRIDRLLVTAKMMTVLSLPFVFLNHALRSPSAMGLSLGLLVILFLLHDPFLRRLREIEATRRWLERELGRLRNGPSPAPPDWMRFQGDHPYDFDLNISGDNGLFVFLSRCRTRIGEITLHRWLLQPVPVSERIRRQEAILELSRQLRFRERFLCDPRESKAAASICSCPAMERVPKKAILPGWLLFLPLLNLPALVLGITGLWWPMMALFFVQFILNLITGLRQKEIVARFRGVGAETEQIKGLLMLMEKGRFSSEMLRGGQARITTGKIPASLAISRLHRLLQCLELRGSSIHPLINNLVLWDIVLIALLSRWRDVYGGQIEEWLKVCGEWEALCSLGTSLFNHPAWNFPEFIDQPLLVEIQGLGHPLLEGRDQTVNDCRIPGPHHLYFVTGPNMAGKSTYIRAVATAAIMALAGAPVCAGRMRLGRLSVVTSLSHTDSLSEGKSLFHKELDRLALIWERSLQPDKPVLFFLDEILRGTNPLDRHNGSLWVLKLLARQQASGLVATHDLGLTVLEDEENADLTVQNTHFSCRITPGECLFDYRLCPGTAPSVNALPLMRQRGFPIPFSSEERG